MDKMERILLTVYSLSGQRNEWRSSLSVTHSTASNGETSVLSRAFLEDCLEERLSQEEDPVVLDWRQREFLELVARSATFGDVIEVPKALLEAFLAGKKQ
jgi:hypothetical protein